MLRDAARSCDAGMAAVSRAHAERFQQFVLIRVRRTGGGFAAAGAWVAGLFRITAELSPSA